MSRVDKKEIFFDFKGGSPGDEIYEKMEDVGIFEPMDELDDDGIYYDGHTSISIEDLSRDTRQSIIHFYKERGYSIDEINEDLMIKISETIVIDETEQKGSYDISLFYTTYMIGETENFHLKEESENETNIRERFNCVKELLQSLDFISIH